MSHLLLAGVSAGALPLAVMDAEPVRVLTAFVATNTVMYAALAVAKVLPRLHPSTWLPGSDRRAQERSIHPAGSHDDAPSGTDPGAAPDLPVPPRAVGAAPPPRPGVETILDASATR
jgi:hypothetical protein